MIKAWSSSWGRPETETVPTIPAPTARTAQWERAPVGSITIEVEARRFIERGAPGAKARAYEERARPIALDHTSLAVYPRVVVGARAGKGVMKELLRWRADIDRHGSLSLTGKVDEDLAEAPARRRG